MDQVALLTAILLLSILGQGANSDQQHKKLVAEIPFNQGETQILRGSKLESCGTRGMPS
jgi:hypothetical protein